jgi:hypothetical protein
MPPDPYTAAYGYGYSLTGATPTEALSVATMVELVIACLLPVLVVVAVVAFEAWTSNEGRRPRTSGLTPRETRLLTGLEQELSDSDPRLARMLATMTLDEGARP